MEQLNGRSSSINAGQELSTPTMGTHQPWLLVD